MHKNRYGHMVHEYTVNRVHDLAHADAEKYVLDIRAKIPDCFPALPTRTDLKAQVTGALDFEWGRVEAEQSAGFAHG